MLQKKILENQLKVTETNYYSVVECSPNAILVHRDWKIVYVNPAAVKMFEAISKEDIVDRELLDLVHKDYHMLVMSRVQDIIERKANAPMVEMQFLSLTKSVIDVEVQGTGIIYEGKPSVHVALRDITKRKETEQSLKETILKLQRSHLGHIEVISKIMELRDLYTADHQKSVACLSQEIAKKLGLSDEEIEDIRLAAFIHDIGKVSIPAEILAKPSKLSNEEYMLVKKHAVSGYEALKDSMLHDSIKLAIYEHHERLDGLGYPRGLRESEISIGAKIIAVADVVDAMMRHRPYRAALGLDAALVEIVRNKGILYDSRVVDICFSILSGKTKT